MEYKRICNTCKRIYCFTDKDLRHSDVNSVVSLLGDVATLANVIGGTRYDMYEQSKLADRAQDKVVDYNKCPYCGSIDVEDVTDEEYEQIQYKETLRGSVGGSVVSANASEESIEKRIEMFLEDNDFVSANTYVNSLLDINPENPKGHYYQLLVENKCCNENDLISKSIFVKSTKQGARIIRYGGVEWENKLNEIDSIIQNNIYELGYQHYCEEMEKSVTEHDYLVCADLFDSLSDYKDACDKAKECRELAENARFLKNDQTLEEATRIVNERGVSIERLQRAVQLLNSISGWKDADEVKEKAISAINEQTASKSKKNRFLLYVMAVIAIVGISGFIYYSQVVVPSNKYDLAVSTYNKGSYEDAFIMFAELGDYKDSLSYVNKCKEIKDFFSKFSSSEEYNLDIMEKYTGTNEVIRKYIDIESPKIIRKIETGQIIDGHYFANHIDNYELVTGKELERLFSGSTIHYLRDSSEAYSIYEKGGMIEDHHNAHAIDRNHRWTVDGDYLITSAVWDPDYKSYSKIYKVESNRYIKAYYGSNPSSYADYYLITINK